MERNNLFTHFKHSDLIIVLIIYSTLAIISINFQYYPLGADGISYVSIAAKYVNGDWLNAINGYWSPLYSWLITPILLFGYNPITFAPYVTRAVSLIAGFFTIIGLSRLSSTFNFDKSSKRILLVTSIPVILFYSIYFDTPDLLVVGLLVYYFSFIFNENYSDKWTNGAICGFLGGLAFLGKTYIFLFFLVHFTFFNILYYYKGLNINKKQLKKNFILGLVVFLAISGMWIATLSFKYDKLTIGTSTEYNHAITGPEYPTHAVYFMGLIKPPNPTATSTWEEPSLVKLEDWSPFESWDYLKYQLELISKNLLRFIIFLEFYSILSLAILIISLYFIFKLETKKSFKTQFIYILTTIFIYSSGYLFIHVQGRYLWPVVILVMFCGFNLAIFLFEGKKITLKTRNIFLVILMFSFVFAPALELFSYPTNESDSYSLIKTLKENYNIHGNIASNTNWEETNTISFLLKNKYYGLPNNTANLSELENELTTNNINYYFVWGDSSDVNLTWYKEVTNSKIQGLKIYQYEKA
jgi:hypothetical protein